MFDAFCQDTDERWHKKQQFVYFQLLTKLSNLVLIQRVRTRLRLFLPGNCVKYWTKYDKHWIKGHWELVDETQLWWCDVEESFCRVIKIPWSTSHCHRLNQDDQQECRNKMIFPCSVNTETGDQPTQDVLSSQRCEAEEDSVVVLDSRYYSFTKRPILENHLAFLPLSWSFVKVGRKRRGIRENIAKGATDPRVEFRLPKWPVGSYHKFSHRSWSYFIFRISTKHLLQNLNQISPSQLNLKFQILTKPSFGISTKIQLHKLYKTSAAKCWTNSSFKILPELQLQNLDQPLCSKSEQKFSFRTKRQLPNL